MAAHIYSGVSAVIKGHRHFSYGGATLPESVTVEQYYDLTPSKKNNVCVSDEIIPKPTSIDVGEKQIKVSIQREHPYQSHISRCAMFPTYHCPDDPDTGVRAASKLPINPLLPANAPKVTVLSKSKGAPYRHELLEIPMETRRKAATWPGQNGFQNHVKPVKGGTQVFYPNAPTTLCPNLTLRDWKRTLLERTAKALRNVEKSQWLTSYQLHFTGTGPTNPINLDDFNDKTISLITGEMNPHTAQLSEKRERSYPVLQPPRALERRRARILQNQHCLENPCPPCSPSFPVEPSDAGMVFTQTHGPKDATAERIPVLDKMQHKPYCASLEDEVFKSKQVHQPSQTCQVVFNNTSYMCDVCCERNCACRPSESDGTKPQTSINKPALTVTETVNTQLKPFFAQHTFQAPHQKKEITQRDLSNSRTQDYVVENNPYALRHTAPPSAEETNKHVRFTQSKNDFKEEDKIRQGSCTIPSICPGIFRDDFGYRVKKSTKDLGSNLLELQDCFSQTKAQRIFCESLQDASVDLRDNHHTGRKHFFYGLNSYYFHD